jgi:hypothetical protein
LRSPHDWHCPKKDFGDRLEVLVVDRSVAVAKSQARSSRGENWYSSSARLVFSSVSEEADWANEKSGPDLRSYGRGGKRPTAPHN